MSSYDYMLFVGNVNSCMYFGQNGEAKTYNSRQASYPRRVVTVAIAVSRGFEGPCQRGVSSHRIATLIQSVAKAIGGPRLLWALFDDGGTALTTTAVTPREQPPGGVRWSCH